MLTALTSGLRGFRGKRGLYWSCVIVLAVGISIAGVSHAVLWSILSPNVPNVDDVANVGVTSPAGGIAPLPAPLFSAIAEQSAMYSAIVGFKAASVVVSWGGNAPRADVRVAGVTRGLFPLLQTRPQLGRAFEEEDFAAGAVPVVLLSHGFWRREFGGDATVLGTGVTIDNKTAVVIGVLPRDFNLDLDEVFVPAQTFTAGDTLTTWVRRMPGRSWAAARAELVLIAARTQASPGRPRMPAEPPIRLATVADQLRMRRAGLVLAFPLLVVLISSFNTGNLLLTHAIDREQEVGIRLALGATRSQLVAQYLAEGLLIAIPAGLVACLMIPVELHVLRVAAGERLAWLVDRFGVHTSTWFFVAGVSVLTPVVFGVAPLAHSLRLSVVGTLRGTRRHAYSGLAPLKLKDVLGARYRLRDLFLVLQVAGTFGLVATFAIVYGLTIALTVPSYAFDTARLLVLTPAPDARGPEIDEVLARIRTIPGISGVALADQPPLAGFGSELVSPFGLEALARATRVVGVDPSYFACLGVRVRGRGITREAVLEHQDVAVISEGLARELWSGDEPAGRALTVRGRGGQGHVTLHVIGTVPDLAFLPSVPASRRCVYVPLGHPFVGARDRYGLLRVVAESSSVSAAVTTAIEQDRVQGGAELPRLLRHSELAERDSRYSGTMFTARLVGMLGVAALVLALAGLVAVTREAVRVNARDLGIRAALGASPSGLIRLVLRHTLTRAAVGLVLGLAIPFVYWSRQEFREIDSNATLLFGNPSIYGILLMATAAVLAGSYWPARAAGRQEPAAAMRDQ